MYQWRVTKCSRTALAAITTVLSGCFNPVPPLATYDDDDSDASGDASSEGSSSDDEASEGSDGDETGSDTTPASEGSDMTETAPDASDASSTSGSDSSSAGSNDDTTTGRTSNTTDDDTSGPEADTSTSTSGASIAADSTEGETGPMIEPGRPYSGNPVTITEVVAANVNGPFGFVEISNGGSVNVNLEEFTLASLDGGARELSAETSTLLTGSLAPGATYVVAFGGDTGTNAFVTAFGLYPQLSTEAAIDGDDPIVLFLADGSGDRGVAVSPTDASIIDVFGEIGTSGVGRAWDYRQGRALRNDLAPPSGTFSSNAWLFAGAGSLNAASAVIRVRATPGTHATAGYGVYSSGTFEIRGTWHADLDEGVEVSFTDDFFWEQMTNTERSLTPTLGAFALMGARSITLTDCLVAAYSPDRIQANDPGFGLLPSGTRLCARTNDDRTALIEIDGYDYTTMILNHETWEPN